jgi:hypothetical protein
VKQLPSRPPIAQTESGSKFLSGEPTPILVKLNALTRRLTTTEALRVCRALRNEGPAFLAKSTVGRDDVQGLISFKAWNPTDLNEFIERLQSILRTVIPTARLVSNDPLMEEFDTLKRSLGLTIVNNDEPETERNVRRDTWMLMRLSALLLRFHEFKRFWEITFEKLVYSTDFKFIFQGNLHCSEIVYYVKAYGKINPWAAVLLAFECTGVYDCIIPKWVVMVRYTLNRKDISVSMRNTRMKLWTSIKLCLTDDVCLTYDWSRFEALYTPMLDRNEENEFLKLRTHVQGTPDEDAEVEMIVGVLDAMPPEAFRALVHSNIMSTAWNVNVAMRRFEAYFHDFEIPLRILQVITSMMLGSFDVDVVGKEVNIASVCSICFTSLSDATVFGPAITVSCKHTFHKRCIKDWCNTLTQKNQGACSCPLCRKTLDTTRRDDSIVDHTKVRKPKNWFTDMSPSMYETRHL